MSDINRSENSGTCPECKRCAVVDALNSERDDLTERLKRKEEDIIRLTARCDECPDNNKFREERDGFRNGQEQMQQINDDLQSVINTYAIEREQLIKGQEKLIAERDRLQALVGSPICTCDYLEGTITARDAAIKEVVAWSTACGHMENHLAHQTEAAEILLRENRELAKERDDLKEDIRFMVEMVAEKRLEGYRELGRKLADREEQIDKLRADHQRQGDEIKRLEFLLDEAVIMAGDGRWKKRPKWNGGSK